MGSYALSTSNTSAIDKRQVVSDNALGVSLDGNANSIGNSGLSNVSVGANGALTMQSLDGGVIGKAFDFANKSLSSVLELAVNRDKAAAFSSVPTGLNSIDSVGSAAQSASAPASAEAVDKAKKIGLVVVVGSIVAVWWLWGRK